MLLDQKRTKRIVQVVAILTSVAFAGVIFVVLGLILFGGGGSSPQSDLLDAARERVAAEPRSPDAYSDLASAHAANEQFDEAIAAASMAVDLAPNEFDGVQTLVALQLQQGRAGAAVEVLTAYTRRNPDDADAFLQLAQRAEQAGRTDLARLSYQRFLTLAPDDASAPDVQARLEQLRAAGGGAAPAPNGG